jgi:hypothetical protein
MRSSKMARRTSKSELGLGVLGRLTLMAGKVMSQSLIYAFVQQNPHSGLGR